MIQTVMTMTGTNDKLEKFAADLQEQMRVLAALAAGVPRSPNADTSRSLQMFERWVSRTAVLIRDNLGTHELENFNKQKVNALLSWTASDNIIANMNSKGAFVRALLEMVLEYPNQLTYTPPATNTRKRTRVKSEVAATKNEIFLIHGHDVTNLLQLEKTLRESFGLRPRVMRDSAAKGRTLIEKFEQEAGKCGYAFALVTPDDLITSADGASYAQARPNVIFELGWMCGRLGRDRICILKRESVTIPSDLSGINWLDFRESVEEIEVKVRRELISAGFLSESSGI